MDGEKCTRIWERLENSVLQVMNNDAKAGKIGNHFAKTSQTDMQDRQKSSAKFLSANNTECKKISKNESSGSKKILLQPPKYYS